MRQIVDSSEPLAMPVSFSENCEGIAKTTDQRFQKESRISCQVNYFNFMVLFSEGYPVSSYCSKLNEQCKTFMGLYCAINLVPSSHR